MSAATIEEQIAEIRAGIARLEAMREPSLVLTRKEAAAALRVSVSQLYRLIAAGRLTALPSGIARAELERYVKAPQPKLTTVMSRGKMHRTANEEADRLDAMLKATRRKPTRRSA
jgi:excisionase family DNA binding protein